MRSTPVVDNLIMIFSELSNETNNYQIKFKNIIEDLVELNDKMELTLIDINNKLDEKIKHYESLKKDRHQDRRY